MKTISALAIGLLFTGSFAPQAAAQFGSGRDRGQDRDRVCLYKDTQYQGSEQCYAAGDEVRSLGGQKGQVSSVRVFGRARIFVYDETDFRGRATEFSSNVPDLRMRAATGGHTWNDRIESIRVTSDYGYYEGSPRSTGPIYGGDSSNRNRNQFNDGICVYDRPNYGGREECWTVGYDMSDLRGWSDRISSIRVFGRTEVVLYRDVNFRGESIVVDRDIPNLRDISGRSFRSWDHQISSLAIETDRGGFPGRGRARGRSWLQ